MTADRIETAADLDALPYGSIVRSDAGTVAARYDAQHGTVFGDDRPFPWSKLRLPVTLLHVPGRDLIAEAEARGAREALLSAADDLARSLPINFWLHPDGSEDPEAARYAGYQHETYDWLRARAEQAGGDR